jgi:uncharacterized membrane protein YcaP (DUF421 family)
MFICFLRVLVIYPIIVFGVRLMGKRQIGELQPTELVISMLISNAATLPLEEQELPLFMGIIPVLMLISFEILLSWGTLRRRRLRALLLGSPQVIIREGEMQQGAMRALRLSLDDLMTALRTNGVFDLREVQLAVVETNGNVSVYQKAEARPVNCGDLKIPVQPADPPEVLIADGCISKEGLTASPFTEKKLLQILRQKKLRPEDVFLLTADASGICTLIPKEDAS